ncbi:MAG TPA: protein kinase [Polyangiaceae bacterium]|nr:protein kinase [Polyangiaceae bacterium]
MDLAPESEFGRYRIRRLLGRGGMGAVYEAVHVDLGKRVALKTLWGAAGTRDDARARFLREAQAAARLDHPHVVDVSDIGIVDDVPFLIMEYLDGEDLHQLLLREAPLAVARIVELVLPIISALGDAHELGIVHRDIKPQNVFLARSKQGLVVPKLLDFGISKLSDGDGQPGLTGSAALLGTPSYMSPEQVRGAKHVDARSDQYSLGVMLYQCATGALPFNQSDLFPLLNAISAGTHERLREVRPDLPSGFGAAVERAMALNPDARFATLRELGQALLPFASPEVRGALRATFGGHARPGVTLTADGAPLAVATVEFPGAQEAPSIEATSATLSGGRRRSKHWPALLGMGSLVGIAVAAWRLGTSGAPGPANAPELLVPPRAVAASQIKNAGSTASPSAASAPSGSANPVVSAGATPGVPASEPPSGPADAATRVSGVVPPSGSTIAPVKPSKPTRASERSAGGSVATPNVRPTAAAVPTKSPTTANNAPIIE